MTIGVGGSDFATELGRIPNRRDAVPPIGAEEHARRLAAAQARMAELGIAALWLDGTTNLAWLTGLRHGQSERPVGAVLPARGALTYLCPAFEVERLKTMLTLPGEVRGWEEDEDPYLAFTDILRAADVAGGTVALDDLARVFVAEGMRGALPNHRFIASAPVTSHLRQRKSEHEVALLRQAMGMTLDIQAAAARALRPGVTTTEVGDFLAAAHRKAGFDSGPAFSIVLFGEATAYPHGVPYPQTLAEGDVVLIDVGAPLHGYMSDITRSYIFGEPSARQRQIWNLDHAAQAAGIAAARPGIAAGAIDDAVRGVVVAAGFGPGHKVPGLPHRAGHGIGLDVHEAPYFVRGGKEILAPGATGSIEPTIAIYGEFGIRLEDHIVITETGAAWLTAPAKSVDDPFGVA
ncbi:M24 family metallopeptidase [Falsiroseomonas selenitidurans]|uniref:Aminopeptidase P family protein n=1 Tax=Falsiroseomonas selenitidurans TaxID=2716335 RepID=A0ABX1DX07_9PROT|nr:Xaa-Pro peptidase family protein [Falsiroseomonas selenitidurans]NKC29311.1 aminopeptidase P family protein [Falsiroseomonas selenitidurans]